MGEEPAAEIRTRHEDRSSLRGWAVQLEGRIGRAIRAKAPVEEQELAEAGPLDALEHLFRNDRVVVDVDSRQRGDPAGVNRERLHASPRYQPGERSEEAGSEKQEIER